MTRTHVKALQPHPSYPPRSVVPPTLISWDEPFPDYNPPDFTHPIVTENNRLTKPNGWADPPIDDIPPQSLHARTCYTGKLKFDAKGRPRNPIGRTGMAGRGLLGVWGPNFAADPIVTRINPDNNSLEMVAIQRSDTQEWAIPGGMVDAGEQVSVTLKREFGEEAMSHKGLTETEVKEWSEQLDQLFHSGVEIYRGYVDDPRNTDNSWMETVAVWFHASPSLAGKMRLNADTDATSVKWMPLEDADQVNNLYASHADFVKKVIARAHSESISRG